MNIKKPIELVIAGISFLNKGSAYLQSPLLLLVRLHWGWQFFQTGLGKLQNLDRTTEFFASLNIPMPGLNAFAAGTTECVGGLLLLAGLASRVTSIPLIVTMVVAYLTSEMDAVKSIFSDPDQFTGATPFLFLMASVIVLAFGPGYFSIDRVIEGWRRAGRKEAEKRVSVSEPLVQVGV